MNKQHLIQSLREALLDKQDRLHSMMQDLQESAANDTKSSMGDKYETSREMTKQEILKLGSQLTILNEQAILLDKIVNRPLSSTAMLGSLVETSIGSFFLGIPLGKFELGGSQIFCLSLESPMGQALLGTTTGQELSFRGKNIQVLNIS